MQTQIDQFGRVVIPKVIRQHLGLKPGMAIEIEESNHDVILKIVDKTPVIKMKGAIAVFVGEATDDLESAIQREREHRLDDVWDQ